MILESINKSVDVESVASLTSIFRPMLDSVTILSIVTVSVLIINDSAVALKIASNAKEELKIIEDSAIVVNDELIEDDAIAMYEKYPSSI
jgi:hypothetical protein